MVERISPGSIRTARLGHNEYPRQAITGRDSIEHIADYIEQLEREKEELRKERDLAREYGREARQRENLAENARVNAVDLASKAERQLAEANERWEHFQSLASEHRDQIERQLAERDADLARVRAAAERVCWFDWSDNDDDAVRSVDDLRAALAGSGDGWPVPDGWKLVPEKITPAIGHALESNFAECSPPSDVHAANWQDAWTKALAASEAGRLALSQDPKVEP